MKFKFTLLPLILFVCSCGPKTAGNPVAGVIAPASSQSATDQNSDSGSDDSPEKSANVITQFLDQYKSNEADTLRQVETSINWLAAADLQKSEQCRLWTSAAALLYATLELAGGEAAELIRIRSLYLDIAEMSSRAALACSTKAEPCNSFGLTNCLTLENDAVKASFLIYYLSLAKVYELTGFSTRQFLIEELSIAANMLSLTDTGAVNPLKELHNTFCSSVSNSLDTYFCERITP